MDMYEVAAIGDLQNGSISDFPWNMREFALIGVKLMYYNRKGQKQGEIDISRCTVRKFEPKEDKLPNYISTTKFPFLIKGNNKTHVLCATSEKNRDLWISILENQIHEFRSPIRRFIRTGEVVHANGFVKRINMFGKTPILLVVTNFPRIIEIYPATVELKDQYTWDPSTPPTFVKVSDFLFKIIIGTKQIMFDDPSNGMAYWEALFARIHRIELWKPAKVITHRVGFNARKAATTAAKLDAAQSAADKSQDIQYLERVLSYVDALNYNLNSKIEEIDLVYALSVQKGNEEKRDDSASRQTKRQQLVLLKDNVTVISDNIKLLKDQHKQNRNVVYDVGVIESIIAQASDLLDLLENSGNNDNNMNYEYTENAGVSSVNTVENIQNIDTMVADIETENIEIIRQSTMNNTVTTTRKLSNLINRSRMSTVVINPYQVQPVTELDLSATQFDPKSPNKRPPGWTEVRMKRVLIKEQQEREKGEDEDVLLALRETKIKEEEILMLTEVSKFGKVLGLKEVTRNRSATLQQDFSVLEATFSDTNQFDPFNPTKRPAFWADIRLKRVMLKEHIARIDELLPESAIVDQRPQREIDEEMTMVGEVLCYGRLLNLNHNTSSSSGSSNNNNDIDKNITTCSVKTFVLPKGVFDKGKPRPKGWNDAKALRVRYKELEEKLNGYDDMEIKKGNAQRVKEEEEDMIQEASSETRVITLLGTRASKRQITLRLDAIDELVQQIDDFQITSPRKQRVMSVAATIAPPPSTNASDNIDEPVPYQNETIAYDMRSARYCVATPINLTASARSRATTVAVTTSATASSSNPTGYRRASLEISHAEVAKYLGVTPNVTGTSGKAAVTGSGKTVPPATTAPALMANGQPWPPGWAEIKLRRVYLKEWEDRKNGVDEDDILDRRYARELEAEQEMLAELDVKGKIALFERGFKKPVTKSYKRDYDLTMFMSSSHATVQSMTEKMGLIVVK